MPTAKSLILAAGSAALYTTRYVTNRIHRKLDERDNLLRDAVYKLEAKPIAEYPCILELDKDLAANETDITMTGKFLVDDATKAVATLFSGQDYELTLTAVLPGEQSFTVEWVGASAASATNLGAAAAVIWDAPNQNLKIYTGSNHPTWQAIATALNADPVANKLIDVTGAGASLANNTGVSGASASATAIGSTTAGEGEIPVLYLGAKVVAPGGFDQTVSYKSATHSSFEGNGETDGHTNPCGIISFSGDATTTVNFDVAGLASAALVSVRVSTAGSSPVMTQGLSAIV